MEPYSDEELMAKKDFWCNKAYGFGRDHTIAFMMGKSVNDPDVEIDLSRVFATIDALKTELNAWKSAFGSRQLTHAIAQRDADRKRIAEAKKVLECEPSADLVERIGWLVGAYKEMCVRLQECARKHGISGLGGEKIDSVICKRIAELKEQCDKAETEWEWADEERSILKERITELEAENKRLRDAGMTMCAVILGGNANGTLYEKYIPRHIAEETQHTYALSKLSEALRPQGKEEPCNE